MSHLPFEPTDEFIEIHSAITSTACSGKKHEQTGWLASRPQMWHRSGVGFVTHAASFVAFVSGVGWNVNTG